MPVTTAMYDGFDNYDKFITSGQAGKGLILLENYWLAGASMVSHS